MSWGWLRPAGAVLVAVVLAHGLAVGGKFHFDDSHTIELNPVVKDVRNIPRIWTDVSSSSAIPENRIFRPFTFTVFNLLWSIGGGSPVPFLILKLLLHAGVATLLGLIWLELFARAFASYDRKQRERTAWAMALLFAVHPACSEIVNYVSATTSLLAALFYTGAFLAFIRHRTFVSLLLYALACFSKEEGVTLPAVLFAYVFLFDASDLPWKARLKAAGSRVWPWALAGVVLAAIVVKMMPSSLSESRGTVSPYLYFLTQWRAYLHYFGMSIAPFSLNADHTSFGFAQKITELPVLLAAFGNAVILWVAWKCRGNLRAITFGIVWFYVAVSPASSVVPLAEPVNEHRMYLGYVGWFGALGSLALFLSEEALRARPSWTAVRGALVLVMLPLCALSQARAFVWNEPERLWRDTVTKNPENGRALNNLALFYIRNARYGEAISLLNRCGEVWPNYTYCAINRGIALGELGRFDEAEQSFKRAFETGTAQVYVNFYYGRFLEEKRQKPAAATTYYGKSISLSGGVFEDANVRLKKLKALGF